MPDPEIEIATYQLKWGRPAEATGAVRLAVVLFYVLSFPLGAMVWVVFAFGDRPFVWEMLAFTALGGSAVSFGAFVLGNVLSWSTDVRLVQRGAALHVEPAPSLQRATGVPVHRHVPDGLTTLDLGSCRGIVTERDLFGPLLRFVYDDGSRWLRLPSRDADDVEHAVRRALADDRAASR